MTLTQSRVYKCTVRLSIGHEGVQDDTRSGAPKIV